MSSRFVVVAAVAVLLVVGACSGRDQDRLAVNHGVPALVVYRADGLAFGHPASWHPATFSAQEQDHSRPSGAATPLVFLSDQPMHAPCHATSDGRACGLPVDQLQPGGVLLEWSVTRYAPGRPPLLTPPTTSLGVSGRRVTQKVGTGGDCTGTEANTTTTAIIDRGDGAAYLLLACLRGSEADGNQAIVQAMISTVNVTAPASSTATTFPPCRVRPQTQPPGGPQRIDDSTPCIPPSSGSDP